MYPKLCSLTIFGTIAHVLLLNAHVLPLIAHCSPLIAHVLASLHHRCQWSSNQSHAPFVVRRDIIIHLNHPEEIIPIHIGSQCKSRRRWLSFIDPKSTSNRYPTLNPRIINRRIEMYASDLCTFEVMCQFGCGYFQEIRC
jgi:hypothetical protein